jgi:hypothetical protein
VGVLFIVGTVCGALSIVVTKPILTAPDYLARISQGRPQMVLGSLLLLAMGFALAMVPVVFYPVGRRHSEVLALGYVVFRGAIESVTYVVSALGWLLLIALSADSTTNTRLAEFVRSAEGVVWDQLVAIPFVIGALMFYYLLFKSRLVPRWLSIWGLAGAVLYLGAPLASMVGGSLGYLMAPLAVQEIAMALWLIAKGFNQVAASS